MHTKQVFSIVDPDLNFLHASPSQLGRITDDLLCSLDFVSTVKQHRRRDLLIGWPFIGPPCSASLVVLLLLLLFAVSAVVFAVKLGYLLLFCFLIVVCQLVNKDF